MKTFKDLELPLSVTTTSGDPIAHFFTPVMSCATRYDIAVGYFSSYWIKDAAEGIYTLVKNGGTSRWVINPDLSDEDIEMLESISDNSERVRHLDHIISDSFAGLLSSLENDTRNTIAWLMHRGILKFRIAYPKNKLKNGIFHAKFGVFTDRVGNKITFTGSYNKTGKSQCNWETIEIFKSWEDSRRCKSKENEFDLIWSGNDENLAIYPPTEGILHRTKEIANTVRDEMNEKFDTMHEVELVPEFPFPSGPMDYQDDAYYKWVENERTGIFAMATGTGKTVTALNCLLKDYEKKNTYKAIIVVPSKYLVGQWEEEIRKFQFYENILRFDSANTKKRREINNLNTLIELGDHKSVNFIIITTYASLGNLLSLMKSIPDDTLLIADEAHRVGAATVLTQFEKITIKQRIGLSATPERFYSVDETERIEGVFNDSSPYVANYALDKAIRDGRLSSYEYHPRVVFLNEGEREKYRELSRKIIQCTNQDSQDKSGENPGRESLLRLRKQVVDKCAHKVSEYKRIGLEHIERYGGLKYCIIYTAKGDGDDDQSILDAVSIELASIPNLTVAQYASTAEFASNEELTSKMKAFGDGDIHTLVAMKMLDEGIDIPRAEIGVLGTSSRDPREFIQRLGRLLRKHPDKQFAHIYDLFVLPGIYPDSESEVNLFKYELQRIITVTRACRNKMEVRNSVEDYMNNFGLYWDILEEEMYG